jgi:hypothetical protein
MFFYSAGTRFTFWLHAKTFLKDALSISSFVSDYSQGANVIKHFTSIIYKFFYETSVYSQANLSSLVYWLQVKTEPTQVSNLLGALLYCKLLASIRVECLFIEAAIHRRGNSSNTQRGGFSSNLHKRCLTWKELTHTNRCPTSNMP